MTQEWKWKSRSGRSFIHIGFGVQDAVGAPKASDAIPIQEGFRLLVSKGIDRIYRILTLGRPLRRRRRRKRRQRRNLQ